MSWCSEDSSIGPLVRSSCRGGLDFTFLFELVCFQYLPCCVFIVGALWKLVYPSIESSRVARSGNLRLEKLIAFGALIAIFLACIIVNGVKQTACRRIAIGGAVTETCASILALRIADQYHVHSSRSSIWVTAWLALSCLLDIANVRTQWLVQDNSALAVTYTLAISLKLVCLLVESISKQSLLVGDPTYSPEELASPLKLVPFRWTYTLLRQGFFKILSAEHLVAISVDLKSVKSMNPLPLQRKSFSLFQDLIKDMPRAFFAPCPARIFLMGFSLAQPFVVHATLNYTLTSKNNEKGSLLIAAYVLVFVGYALSNALYWYLVDRFRMKSRSRLIELVYDCTYNSSRNFDNSTTPSLITTDMESFLMGMETFHEIWASLLQISIAAGILSIYIGWACVGPLAACFGCLILTVPLVIFIAPALVHWNAAVADRISMTTCVLRQLREVRLLGLGETAFALVQQLRRREIAKAFRFRRLLFYVILWSQAPLALCPLVTFALYAFKVDNGRGLAFDFVIRAFTALNLIGLIFTPFTLLLQSAPLFSAGIGALYRVQQFIDAAMSTAVSQPMTCSAKDENALEVEDASFSWSDGIQTVRHVSFELPRGHFLVVTGPVGSGKSTLLAGLLNLTRQSYGTISRNTPTISYCPQNPWIMSGSVRQNIVCGLDFDQAWFDTTIATCALAADLKRWEHADLYEVGNDGGNLSGGQRQRVALARAVYARNSLVFLDDPLSGLDSASSQHIQRQLLGPNGLLRRHGVSVVIVTHYSELIASADQVLSLAKEGTVAYQGSPASYLTQASESMHVLTVFHELNGGYREHHTDFSRPPDDSGQGALALAREDANRKTGDWSVYWYYAKASGRTSTLMFLLGAALTAASWQIGVFWIKVWSEDALHGRVRGADYYIGIYGLITVSAGIGLAATAAGCMVYMVSRGSSNFHLALLQSVSRASVSYFGAADIGITLNRFIQDLRLIDWELPLALTNTVTYLFICITQAVVIANASRYMGLAVVIAMGILVAIQRFYLRTSRQLRLLDIEAKAPLYTNFHETIEGIPSIRAYGEGLGQVLREKQSLAANASQQPMFLLYVVQRLLLLIIDLVVAILATSLITLVVKDPSTGQVASLGVGLVNLTLFNQFLSFVIRYWTELENSLGAVSRIKNFAAKTPMASGCRTSDRQDLEDISLENLQAATNPDVTVEGVTVFFERTDGISADANARVAALENVTLNIPAGRKLAIVGRSGSGKSTLLSCLARVMLPSQGTIHIGGVDIASLDQEMVQSHLICVTQAFFFLPNISLKDNLDLGAMVLRKDPFHERAGAISQDEDMVNVLQDVEMWSAVEERGGLTAIFDPGVWSVGEVQLLNLARAVLKARRARRTSPHRGWKVLLLDEATSSVDRQTAVLMRRVIKRDFEGYTIIAVEHRLEDIKDDLDWIVRLDRGRIVEEGRPAEILV